MKIAVLSDIHGNMPALLAVAKDIDAWQPDKVIVNGDIVNRGPCSQAALRYVLGRRANDGWHLLRGNHEDFLIRCGHPDSKLNGPALEINRFVHFAYEQLNGELEVLLTMPERFSWFAPDSSEFRVIHASMNSNRDGIYPGMADDDLRQRIMPPPAVFVTGHTHQPLIRQIDETLVVNVGSAGAPFDLNWRPSYGRFTLSSEDGWRAKIVRVEYDRTLVEQDYVRSGFLEEGGPLAQIMLVELRRARGLIYYWSSKYETAVTNGEISLEDSVKRILQESEFRPFLGPPGWVL
jgi:predicted phosphodiesterase